MEMTAFHARLPRAIGGFEVRGILNPEYPGYHRRKNSAKNFSWQAKKQGNRRRRAQEPGRALWKQWPRATKRPEIALVSSRQRKTWSKAYASICHSNRASMTTIEDCITFKKFVTRKLALYRHSKGNAAFIPGFGTLMKFLKHGSDAFRCPWLNRQAGPISIFGQPY